MKSQTLPVPVPSWVGLLLFLPLCLGSPVLAGTAERSTERSVAQQVQQAKLDRSGKKRKGKASFYSHKFTGRKMADGTPMKPESNVAASRTLPLGTKARVTNLENGRSAEVEIRDRGPYVRGRTVDLSPRTAKDLDFMRKGVARVEVAPISVPQADGSVLRGEGAPGS